MMGRTTELTNADFTTPGPYDEHVFCLVFNPANNSTVLYKVMRLGIEPSVSEEHNPVNIDCHTASEHDFKIAEEFLEWFYGGKYAIKKDFLDGIHEQNKKQMEKFGIIGPDDWNPCGTVGPDDWNSFKIGDYYDQIKEEEE